MWSEFLIDYCYSIKETISHILWRLFPTNFTWSILENFVPLCFCLEFLWNCRGDDLKISVCQFIVHNAQKMKFSVKDFSSGNCEFVHIYWRNPQWKTIFCVVVEVKNALTSRIEWGWFFTKIFLNNLSLLVYEFSKFIFD